MKTIIKNKKNSQLKLLLLLMIMLGTANMHAQIRVGGSTVANPNAVLDLNANDTINGSKGLLLPRVALVSTTNASPLAGHIKGMFVFNTATVNDVFSGAYYNDGTKWVRTGESEANNLSIRTRILHMDVDETIGTQSVILSGESDAVIRGLYLQSIRPIFSDDEMAQTYFTVTSSVKFSDDGTKIMWRTKITNSNIDENKSSTLTKIMVTYESDIDYGSNLKSSKRVQKFVGN
jgi:hypothetical protein